MPWNPVEPPRIRLSALFEDWYEHHGRQLRDGEARKAKLANVAKALGDPFAHELTPERWSQYRTGRASSVSTATLNRELSYVRAAFRLLRRLGVWPGPDPLEHVQAGRERDPGLRYLSFEEMGRLWEALQASRNPDVYAVARLACATGARWSEAERLESHNLHESHVVYAETKSGKRRVVPITKELFDECTRDHAGRLYRFCYDAFGNALDRAEIVLPKGQRTHVLRHTFASHFMLNGGNILELQQLLGHSSLAMTMRYAHLAPGHLADARRLNPIALAKQR